MCRCRKRELAEYKCFAYQPEKARTLHIPHLQIHKNEANGVFFEALPNRDWVGRLNS